MTDNKTATELRPLFDKHGVKWWPMRSNGYYEERDTEFVVDGKKYTAHEWGDGFAVYNLTAEQAIAATLGSDRENELRAALNKAAGNWAKADRLARDIWEQVSHCPDYPIPPCMTENICEQFRNLSDVEQAATLGIGECEIYRVGNTQDVRKCSACGKLMHFNHPLDRDCLNYCPSCGRRVKR